MSRAGLRATGPWPCAPTGRRMQKCMCFLPHRHTHTHRHPAQNCNPEYAFQLFDSTTMLCLFVWGSGCAGVHCPWRRGLQTIRASRAKAFQDGFPRERPRTSPSGKATLRRLGMREKPRRARLWHFMTGVSPESFRPKPILQRLASRPPYRFELALARV